VRHSNPEFADIAKHGTILQTEVGSGVHGLAIYDAADRDEMGICLEPPAYVVGLRKFEQYQYRTAAERTGVADARSEPGDLDLVTYSARKWLRLALDGNPTVITPLFAPDDAIVHITPAGNDLRANADMVVSRQAGHRFLGYLHGQRQRMLNGNVHARVNRPELVEKYGHDTKYAAHMVRLAVQGVELLETGRLTLPMAEPWRTWIRDLRQGKHTQQEAIDAAADLEARLEVLTRTADLPERPDAARADRWLVEAYQDAWVKGRWVP
jgi:predicted nucleotidyltransferase